MKKVIFECNCGHPGFFSIEKYEDENEIWISMTDEPSSFWYWLKMWWDRKVYHMGIILYPKDIKKLKKFMTNL